MPEVAPVMIAVLPDSFMNPPISFNCSGDPSEEIKSSVTVWVGRPYYILDFTPPK